MSEIPAYMNDAPMAGDIISPPRTTTPHNPFADNAPEHISAGTVAIEGKRAAAEVQGRIIVAKQFPRDRAAAFQRAMDACQRPGLANSAVYSFPRGGQKVEGPSIRLAEELARCWGNIEYGLRELSRRNGESEMEAFAWDLETNTRSVQNFTVRHIRDTRGGGKSLTDERDVYEITANMGARRLRSRILAILPPELVDSAINACVQTRRSGGNLPLADRVLQMTAAFAKLGVTPEMIAARLEHPVDQSNPDEISEMLGIYTSINDSMSKVSDWFGPKATNPAISENADAFEKAAAGKADPEPKPKPEATSGNQQPEGPSGWGEWVSLRIKKINEADTLDRLQKLTGAKSHMDAIERLKTEAPEELEKLTKAAAAKAEALSQ